jgi:hypothetical protein
MKYSLPSRELIADSVELVVQAHGFDALVFVPNCDKIIPGMLMAAARLNIPSIFVSGGPMLAGRSSDGKYYDVNTLFMAVGKAVRGEMKEEELTELEEIACPGCGSCAGMFTANTMNCLTEALGMGLPGNGTIPAVDARRLRLAKETGRRVMQLYATNLRHLLAELCPAKDGRVVVNMEDEVIRGATVVHEGAITWPPPARPAPPRPATAPVVATPPATADARRGAGSTVVPMLVGALVLLGLGQIAPPAFMEHFTVFVLACFVGYQVIWNVTPALHTPLMSVTNAISGIIVIGALLQVSQPAFNLIGLLSGIAILIATINIAGGFLVTQRMLRMFRRDTQS